MSRKALHSLQARLWSDESGATIVEFAFVLLPLLIVLLGGLDVGYQAYVRSVLQGALYDVARSGSMEAPSLTCAGDTVEERIDCALRERSDTVARNATYEIEMSNFFDFSTVGRSEKLITDYNNNGRYNTGDCFVDLNGNGAFDQDAGREGVGGADDVVFYQVTLTMPRLLPTPEFLSLPENYEITAQTAIRNQPYARQATPPTVCA
jgi:hypothetical protein